MRARFVNENTFERGRSVKATLGLGKIALIKKLFDDLGKSSNEYVINDDFSIDYNGYLHLGNTNITELPDNLTVNGNLCLINTKITKLPDNLKVKNNIWILKNMKLIYVPEHLKDKINITNE